MENEAKNLSSDPDVLPAVLNLFYYTCSIK